MTIPTRTEADELVAAQKVISAHVQWSGYPNGWRLNARVFVVPTRTPLDLRAVIGKTNHSFALLYRSYPIRKYTKHFEHRVGKQVFDRPHKHTWDEELEDREAYYPEDIDPESDINDQFLAFCKECNIELVGGYQSVNYHIR